MQIFTLSFFLTSLDVSESHTWKLLHYRANKVRWNVHGISLLAQWLLAGKKLHFNGRRSSLGMSIGYWHNLHWRLDRRRYCFSNTLVSGLRSKFGELGIASCRIWREMKWTEEKKRACTRRWKDSSSSYRRPIGGELTVNRWGDKVYRCELLTRARTNTMCDAFSYALFTNNNIIEDKRHVQIFTVAIYNLKRTRESIDYGDDFALITTELYAFRTDGETKCIDVNFWRGRERTPCVMRSLFLLPSISSPIHSFMRPHTLLLSI